METQPPYNSEKYSTDIYFERISRPSSQKSYSKTPRRAQNGGRERREKKEEPRLCGLAKQGAVGREMRERKVGKRRGSESKSHLLRRTLSSQSLQSCNSSDASGVYVVQLVSVCVCVCVVCVLCVHVQILCISENQCVFFIFLVNSQSVESTRFNACEQKSLFVYYVCKTVVL